MPDRPRPEFHRSPRPAPARSRATTATGAVSSNSKPSSTSSRIGIRCRVWRERARRDHIQRIAQHVRDRQHHHRRRRRLPGQAPALDERQVFADRVQLRDVRAPPAAAGLSSLRPRPALSPPPAPATAPTPTRDQRDDQVLLAHLPHDRVNPPRPRRPPCIRHRMRAFCHLHPSGPLPVPILHYHQPTPTRTPGKFSTATAIRADAFPAPTTVIFRISPGRTAARPPPERHPQPQQPLDRRTRIGRRYRRLRDSPHPPSEIG